MRALGFLPPSLYILFLLSGASIAGEISLTVSPESREIFQGGVSVISVSGEGLVGVNGFLRGRKVPFFPSKGSGSYSALLGVDLAAKPGPVTLAIRTSGKVEKRVPVVLRIRKKKIFHGEIFRFSCL